MVEFKPTYIAMVILLISAIVLIIYIFYKTKAPSKNEILDINDYDTISVQVNGKLYKLKFADTNKKRQQGLMYIETLPKNEGMLFVFEKPGIYPFWMKDTKIPLDIIWLDDTKQVVYIKENAKPCATTVGAVCKSIIPTKKAKYVIELNAGEVKNLNLKPSDTIEFHLNNLNNL